MVRLVRVVRVAVEARAVRVERGRHRLDAVDATLKTKTPSQHMYLKSFSQAAWNIVEMTRFG